MLNTISGVPNWGKVAKGLPKMYVDEVLKKFDAISRYKRKPPLPSLGEGRVRAEKVPRQAVWSKHFEQAVTFQPSPHLVHFVV